MATYTPALEALAQQRAQQLQAISGMNPAVAATMKGTVQSLEAEARRKAEEADEEAASKMKVTVTTGKDGRPVQTVTNQPIGPSYSQQAEEVIEPMWKRVEQRLAEGGYQVKSSDPEVVRDDISTWRGAYRAARELGAAPWFAAIDATRIRSGLLDESTAMQQLANTRADRNWRRYHSLPAELRKEPDDGAPSTNQVLQYIRQTNPDTEESLEEFLTSVFSVIPNADRLDEKARESIRGVATERWNKTKAAEQRTLEKETKRQSENEVRNFVSTVGQYQTVDQAVADFEATYGRTPTDAEAGRIRQAHGVKRPEWERRERAGQPKPPRPQVVTKQWATEQIASAMADPEVNQKSLATVANARQGEWVRKRSRAEARIREVTNELAALEKAHAKTLANTMNFKREEDAARIERQIADYQARLAEAEDDLEFFTSELDMLQQVTGKPWDKDAPVRDAAKAFIEAQLPQGGNAFEQFMAAPVIADPEELRKKVAGGK